MRSALTIMLVAMIATGMASAQERPFLSYQGDVEALTKSTATILAADETELVAGLVPGDRKDQANASALAATENLFKLVETTDDGAARARALVILRTICAPLLDATDDALRAQITENGAQDASNLAMRDFTWDLARIWRLSADQAAAHKCAVILQRLAQVMPTWPLVTREGELKDQDDEAQRRAWDANGLWGGWFVSDVYDGLPVVRAFDLIYDSGAMQDLGALELIDRDLIRYIPEHYFERPVDMGNITHYLLKSLPLYGMALPEPRYVHIAVQRYRWLINAVYYSDGFWHEGSPAYHKDITGGLTRNVPAVTRGYSDPPGYTSDIDLPRYDDLDLATEYARQHTRMWDALKKLTFPNKDYAKLHDATYPHGAWWDDRPTEAAPRILGAMGHAILGTNPDPDQAELHLHYSGTHGHEHHDALSIIFFARNRELLSETKYRVPDGWSSTREWQTMTAGHNTVVIDETEQQTRFPDASHRRPITEADAMDGIPNWRYRDGGHGNTLNDPKLRCYAPDWDPVQVVEAEAERAWFPDPEIYRRTMALVHVDEHQVYAVDIFRVRGGATHDWMLHGCLQNPYELSVSPSLAATDGTVHKYLDGLRTGDASDGWTATFEYEQGAASTTHMLPQPDSTLIVGRGPAMRHAGYADFIDVRRESAESVFVAVHDAWEGEPNVLSIEAVDWGGALDVGLRVHLANGMTDLILSSGDSGLFAEQTTADGITFAGRFAHVRYDADSPVHAYGVDATRLTVGETDLRGPGWYEGEVTATRRTEAGAEVDAFETNAPLPAGLEGRCLVVDLGGTLTQAFMIDRVEPTAAGALIHSLDEPGVEIRGDLIKMMYYPGWGIPRPARFHIADTLLWQAD